LRGDEARHLGQVLRIRRGAFIHVFDGLGKQAEAEVLSVSRDEVTLNLGEARIQCERYPDITLAQAIPKGKNMDLIVQKAVELGVAAIQPLITRNTVVHPGEGKPEKWRRTALEACKQCGQAYLPHIAGPMNLDSWLPSLKESPGIKLVASLAPGALPLRTTLLANPAIKQATLLIGPEGDLTADETTAALDAGFIPVSLGGIVLRVETAALYCISALRYQYSP
jgi:16S rRNA (uracil1498-N3)-methyltransferase